MYIAKRQPHILIAILIMAALSFSIVASAKQSETNTPTDVVTLSATVENLATIGNELSFETPEWAIERPVVTATPTIVRYSIKSDGAITANLSEFATIVNQTLNDPRGWTRLGITFDQVTANPDMTIILTEDSHVPNYSPEGCSAELSCTVGNNILINQTRWLYATDAWNNAGGTLLDYRYMVINHETGHWLGHPHAECSKPGTPAPVMRQQSTSLGGCTPNSWPIASELWSTRLGISI